MSNQKNNETIRIVKGSLRYAAAPDTDLFIQVPFNASRQNKIEGDRTTIVNVEERFEHERQISTKFRITGKITNIFNNDIVVRTDYIPFAENLYYTNAVDARVLNPNTNIAPNYSDWRGYPQYDEFSFVRTSSVPNHIPFVAKSAGTYNWTMYMSYASSNYSAQTMVYTDEIFNQINQFQIHEGVPYVIKNNVVNGKKMITFYCGFNHNLSEGDWVYLGVPVNNQRFFQVYSLGDEYYGNEDKVFNVFNIGYVGAGFNDQAFGTFKRVGNISNSGETMSKYYVRKHKILTEASNADVHKLGFENNPFPKKRKVEFSATTPNQIQRISVKDGNQTVGFSFDKDVDIIGLMDNHDRPVTELFVTIINRGYMGWFNRPTQNTCLEIGWDFNFKQNTIDDWWNKPNPHNKSDIPFGSYIFNGQTFYYNDVLHIGDEIKGDICEWNDYEQKEYVSSRMSHKYSFNPQILQGVTMGDMSKPYGYAYHPHYPIQIRAYSDYIEVGTKDKVDDIPDYSFYSAFNGQWRWRDIYPYGFVDSDGIGVDNPFLNNRHYNFKDILFLQTPMQKNKNVLNDVIFQPIIDNCE